MSVAKNYIESVPFPYFIMDEQLKILGVSDEVFQHFPQASNFMDLVDYGSIKKVEKFMKSNVGQTKIEINMLTKHQPITLFDVYIQWDSEKKLNVFCIEKQEFVHQVQSFVTKLEKQLNNENLTIAEKQDELEHSLKRVQQLLMQHDNLSNISKLVSHIADELKKPLTSIRGFLQLLKPHLSSIGKEHYANIALDEINQANNLIYQYLNTTKPATPNKTQSNLQKMITEVVQLTNAESKKIHCEVKYVKEHILPAVNVDVKQMKQVFLNILRNGMEAIQNSKNRNNGQILIRTDLTDDAISISFEDNGIGMTQVTIANLFTPFFTMKEKGTGIGLAVSLHIINMHGGTIEVKSEAESGSQFTIILPIDM
ncbi:ATP-binding protein [Cytobacillus gottheilii]|uniref:ATP-binding protein n=1 Tax=Cytobacillus gottheilii TaxID=859144 RepID=UPI00082A0278|nr:ATP-binding protein [Cytobacillus gottheilii]